MHYTQFLAALASLAALVDATPSPTYSGYTRKWEAGFIGPSGQKPSAANWNIRLGNNNDNNELQTWTDNPKNLRFSGSESLLIIPLKDSSAPRGWTSARIESAFSITPQSGKTTRIEASLRIAGNPQKNKQGLWPSFWLMGDSYRSSGVPWPSCGEIDVFETINGQPTSYAVLHCDKYPGGICNEPNGLVSTTSMPDNQFHVYRVEIDRKSSNWRDQSITWFMDGKQVQRVTGNQINNQGVWTNIAQSPLYIILNVAMGGNWPGPPNADTWDGTGNMMEVRYVAHYVSN
jgi:beta-glucanase (GH16 family)